MSVMLLRTLFTLLIAPILFSLLVSTLVRALLYITYSDYFSTITFIALIETFAYGLRFDLSITTISYVIFFLPLIALVWLGSSQRLFRYLLWPAYAVISLTWILYISSVVYFGEVKRHISTELLHVSEDLGFILSLMSSDRVVWLVLGVAFIGLTAVLWNSLIVKKAAKTPNLNGWKNKTAFSFLVLLVATLFVRGLVLDGKTISIADAYALGNERQANLAMNGAFSIVHNTRRASKNEGSVKFYSDTAFEALKNKYNPIPFQRVIPSFNGDGKKQNIVFLLLESWSVEYIDGLAGTSYSATPFMDSIIAQSRVWTNTYAAGQRSIEGVQATLASIPLLEGRQTLGWGLEQNRMTCLAKEANDEGYHTVMMQTSSRRSFHMDAIARMVGFSEYYGMEDFPDLRDYPVGMPDFGWDYEGLMFLSNHLKSLDSGSPYFAFFFTGTTHEPFPNPGSEFHVFPHGENQTHNYLNTLRYSDWSIQQFMQKMQELPTYKDTIFIFMADHVLRAATDDKHASFNIPLIVYSPSNKIPAGVDTSYASQYDLMPTLASLMGINKPVSTFGRSLLTEKPLKVNGSLSKQGNNYAWFEAGHWLSFDSGTGALRDYSNHTANEENLQGTLEWNKFRLQYVNSLLKTNSWVNLE